MIEELFAGIFPTPYIYERWLADQATLIERMKKIDDEYVKEQAAVLEKFQKANQCSSLLLELIVDRLRRHEKTKESNEKKDLTTEEEAVSINNI